MTKASSYHLDCCSAECEYLDARPDEPCWGAVVGTGDDWNPETEEEWRHHACEGHARCNDGEAYRAEPVPVGHPASDPKDPTP